MKGFNFHTTQRPNRIGFIWINANESLKMSFLRPTERKLLEKAKNIGMNVSRKYLAREMGKETSTVNSHLTRIFQRYVEAQEIMAEYYPMFTGRLRRNKDEIKGIEKRLRKAKREHGR